ncbi:MAG: polysaccharide deacetylase family protein [Gemmataceae bacterium]|nr:polysaccharide deacetylase family protein [Gemmataceae bacterium]
MNHRPTGTLSLDLDNLWSYLKTHGDAGWSDYPSYLGMAVPRILDFLRQEGLTITFFIVGQDAVMPEHQAVLPSIPRAGHEIGNHSFQHEPWLHLYTESEVDAEISRAEEAIERAVGVRPSGFRGPGFSLSPTVLQVLARRGYLYDASTFPTYIGPLARAYYFATARLTSEEKARRRQLFGQWSDGLRPLSPYLWRTRPRPLLEIPVTTLPWIKAPIHVSYLLYLATFSRAAALAYFRTALVACRVARVSPSLLLHPLDFLGGDDVDRLSFFPAMSLRGTEKLALCRDILRMFSDHFIPMPLARWASSLDHDRLPRLDIAT